MPATSLTRKQAKENAIVKIKQEWQQKLSTLNEVGKGSVMGMFLGAIAAPMAFPGAESLAATIAGITGGIGGNLLADFIRDYWNAKDDAAREQVLEKMLALLKEESEKSDHLLIAARYIMEKIDALEVAQKELSENLFTNFQTQIQKSIILPAHSAHQRQLVRDVKEILQLSVGRNNVFVGGDLADHIQCDLVMNVRIPSGRFYKTAVKCMAVHGAPIKEEQVATFVTRLSAKKQRGEFDDGLLIVDGVCEPAALSLARENGWQVRTYDNWVADQMDFTLYLDYLIREFSEKRDDSDMPAWNDYYVPVEAIAVR